MKVNKMAIFLIILIVWAVFSIAFIARDYWQKFKTEQLQAAYGQGYQQAIIEVGNEVAKCQSEGVALNLGNNNEGNPITVTIFAAECFQQAEAPVEETGEEMVEE